LILLKNDIILDSRPNVLSVLTIHRDLRITALGVTNRKALVALGSFSPKLYAVGG